MVVVAVVVVVLVTGVVDGGGGPWSELCLPTLRVEMATRHATIPCRSLTVSPPAPALLAGIC